VATPAREDEAHIDFMKVITCFSYKGGAGRTTAAGNIAAALSSINDGFDRAPLKRKVALIDLDVFSAGTHRVFGIGNEAIFSHKPCVQEYLRNNISPDSFVREGGITLEDDLMVPFRAAGATGNCDPEFTLFPARPDPRSKFVVQKLHENVLIELRSELENQARPFDYLILDGESGTREMADIALRLADVILLFFRMTWQHIEGTLKQSEEMQDSTSKPFHLIPTCVPLAEASDGIYQNNAPGLDDLRKAEERVASGSGLNRFLADNRVAGHFWAGKDLKEERQICVHDSLWLKGAERILVFDPDTTNDRTPIDNHRPLQGSRV
jgi:cellulose biosynthesis protein BcsQ